VRQRRADGAEADTARLLVPIIREPQARTLLEIGDAFVAQSGGEGVALGIVEVPHRRAANLTATVIQRRRELLRWIAQIDERAHPPGTPPGLGIGMRVAHDVSLGIREAVYEYGSNLIMIEWPGPTSRRPRLLGQVVDDLVAAPPANLVLVRTDPSVGALRDSGRPVMAPVRGGPNARLSVMVAAALAQLTGGGLTMLHVYQAGSAPAQRRLEQEEFERLTEPVASLHPHLVERESTDPARTILSEATAWNVFVLGAHADPTGSPLLIRATIARTVRRLPGTVLMVRTTSSVSAAMRGSPERPVDY
jgi:hypothetical protein